ncbi:MAG: hypothetical protein EA352_05365 [Gemmatimonadales bacterium]|nr:MAG: hypothetical protein EA352_05365 [Gemmatimonadales bacterium]
MTRPSPPAPFQNCGCTPLRVSAAGAPDGGASEGVSTGGVNAAGSLVAPLASLLLIILLLAGCGTGAEAGGVPGDRETDVRFRHEMAPTPPDLRGLPAGTVLTLEVVDVGGSAKGPARPGDRLHLRLVEPVVGMGERRVPAGARVVAVVGRDAGSLEVVESSWRIGVMASEAGWSRCWVGRRRPIRGRTARRRTVRR